MHDGQNLFAPSYSFMGVTWGVADAMNQGAADGTIREAIVIGIGNTPDRIWEYTPSDGGYGGGGASAYLRFVTDELKPQIDQHLRVSADRRGDPAPWFSPGRPGSPPPGGWGAPLLR